MGARCSKDEDSDCRRKRCTLFQSCLGGFSCSADSFHDRDQRKERGGMRWRPFMRRAKGQPDGVKCQSCIKGEGSRSIPITEVHSGVGFDGWVQENGPSTESADGGSSGRTLSTVEPLGSSNRFNRRLKMIPDHGHTILTKATSLGSSEACSVLSNGPEISNSVAACIGGGLRSGSGLLQENNSCSSSTLPSMEPSNGGIRGVDSSDGERQLGTSASVVQQWSQVVASDQDGEDQSSVALSETAGSGPSRSHLGAASGEQRRTCRRTGTLEAAGDGIQFGRTLSVGRLRDRVLRRNSSSRGSFNHVVYDDRDVRQSTVRQILDSATKEIIDQRAENPQTSSNYNLTNAGSSVRSANNSHQLAVNNQQGGADANTNNPPLHRATFLERRQGVRSQVHALQRLGSRFENLVGHDRSCILSGHYRSGRCLCRTGTRQQAREDDSSTRSSISRIVMLAEALFEVLDEIHQQSVVLSSRPSVSSFGSVPAPREDVERLPLKLYTRSGFKNEEAALCHICLVEYEEGDWMRILPCQHEFHQSCVDKWLKEIHRVCPLCRGNICFI